MLGDGLGLRPQAGVRTLRPWPRTGLGLCSRNACVGHSEKSWEMSKGPGPDGGSEDTQPTPYIPGFPKCI